MQENEAEVFQPLGGAACVALSALMRAEALIQWNTPESRTVRIFVAVIIVAVGGLHRVAVAAGQSCGTHSGGGRRGGIS